MASVNTLRATGFKQYLAYGHCAFQKDNFSDVGTAGRQRWVSGFRKVKADSSSVSCRRFAHAHSLHHQRFIIPDMVSFIDLLSLLSARSGRVLRLQRRRIETDNKLTIGKIYCNALYRTSLMRTECLWSAIERIFAYDGTHSVAWNKSEPFSSVLMERVLGANLTINK